MVVPTEVALGFSIILAQLLLYGRVSFEKYEKSWAFYWSSAK